MKTSKNGVADKKIFGIDVGPKILDISTAQKLFTPTEMQKKMEELIYDTLGEVSSDHMGELNQWDEIDRTYPKNTKMLVINNEICGFWTFLVLTDEFFDRARQGKLHEADITLQSLDSMKVPKDHKGYFLDIVVSPKYRTMQNFLMLIRAFIEQLEAYAESGNFLVEWCANGYSDAGRKLCKTFGLEYVCNHEQEGEGEIYYGKLKNETLNLPIFKEHPRLVELYGQHFKNHSNPFVHKN